VREVARLAAHLPEAAIGLAPAALHFADDRADERPLVLVGGQPEAPGVEEQIDDLAVHVELELTVRAVAEPHGLGALVAAEPIEVALGNPALPEEAVHDLQLARVARDRAQQPPAPALGGSPFARAHQRVERERRVA